ncbi:N-acyl homoserine lactonase family protein [Leucobacter allii]|uniref:N-acyl homoserine lactonase family protein n=1 Tax=Leucobacter allii TaxID=2932247 RepID=UPI001FD398F4|nr:N-acyl homoserine lactonase family protein [Leucobacter allii]UOR00385.1 N-acyl homoserine lactonase family protein [Leucobacter allii]
MAPKTWEILIIKHGTRAARRSDVYMNYGFYGEPDDAFRLDYYLWVLRSGDDVIHVDTGYSAAGAAKRGREVLIDPLDALARIGLRADAGNPVVVTHAHYDHIGNLGAFSRSPVHIARREFAFWTGEYATRPLFAHYGDQEEIRDLVRARAEGRLREFDERAEIAPGVELIEVGGHTPGQLVVRVATEIGPVILAADAAHFHEELDRDMLFQSMADLPRSYAALDWLRSAPAAAIVTGHDAGELQRFAPLGEPLPGLAAVIGARRA